MLLYLLTCDNCGACYELNSENVVYSMLSLLRILRIALGMLRSIHLEKSLFISEYQELVNCGQQ